MEFVQQNLDEIVVLSRLAERALIVVLITSVCIFLMRVYRDRVQAIDLTVGGEGPKLGLAASFGMPVFLFLVLVLFAYVSFNSPIQYERLVGTVDREEPAVKEPEPFDKGSTDSLKLVGLSADEDDTRNWVRGLGVVGSIAANLNDKRLSNSLTEVDVVVATEKLYLALEPLGELRETLITSLHPDVSLRQNCLQYVGPGAVSPPPSDCEDFVEDMLLGIE